MSKDQVISKKQPNGRSSFWQMWRSGILQKSYSNKSLGFIYLSIYLFIYLFIYFCSFSEIFRTVFLENTSGQIFQQ